ncbi:unnamed protein product [Dibothriocephalus latus]|uniref:Uncharacterized protein n=1 Tax=Dibothriocephalus latus TaxID=60516 RepID=A0A3P7LLB8_DIBLA|nr:unnamed protein product [Dibothriocephalus latus]
MSGLLSYFLFHLLIYVCMLLFGGKEAKPPECIEYRRYIFEKRLVYCTGGTYLNVFIFFAAANLTGQLMEFIGLPGPIGMVLSGCGLRWFADLTYHAEIIRGPLPSSWWNIFWTTNQTHKNLKFLMKCSIMVMDEDIFARFRQIALATAITRAGLNLNPSLVKQISGGIARMPIIPCLIEGLLTMPIYKYWVKLPWAWAIMLRCHHPLDRTGGMSTWTA